MNLVLLADAYMSIQDPDKAIEVRHALNYEITILHNKSGLNLKRFFVFQDV